MRKSQGVQMGWLTWYQEWGVDEVWLEGGAASLSLPERVRFCPLSSPSLPSPPREAVRSETSNPRPQPLIHIKNLDALRDALEAFEGCDLKESALNTVFSDGNPSAKVMIVGEAPGADEDRQGKPFVGLSGQLLDRMLTAIHLDRSCVYISNIVPWRPPGNRQPSSAEVSLCLPFIERHISLVNPEVLLIVGGTAVKALLQTTQGITRLRGQWVAYQNPYLSAPIMALPTFHPAYLLRSPGQKREAWKDLLKLQQRLRGDQNAQTGGMDHTQDPREKRSF